MNKIFSIIVPTYNCSDLLKQTLDSIVVQDNGLFECIIVDGKSGDNTVDTILKYKETYPNNIRYISESDKGVYDAMNKGIALSEGEYLYFIGAGDTLVDGILAEVAKSFKYNTEIIYGNIKIPSKNMVCGEELNKEKVITRTIWHQGIFYNKNVFKIMGKYNLKYPIMADTDYNIRCFGNDLIHKKYINLMVANYIGGGLSDNVVDAKFLEDYKENITNCLGKKYYDLYVQSGRKFIDSLKIDSKKSIVIGDMESINFAKKDIDINNSIYNKKSGLMRTYCIEDEKNLNIDITGIDTIYIGYGCDIAAKYSNLIDNFRGEIIETKYFSMDIEFLNYIKDINEDDIIVFGTSNLAERFFYYLRKSKINLNVMYFMDNNVEKHNKELFGKKIYNPCKININKKAKIVVASTWFVDIKAQLIKMGIDANNIIRLA